MKYSNPAMLLILFLFGVMPLSEVRAEMAISDPAEIAGKWLLESTALKRDGKREEENIHWEFRADGTLVTRGYNYLAKREMTVEDTYEIVDGRIVTGQSGTYTVLEKSDTDMVMKGPFGFYFFKKE